MTHAALSSQWLDKAHHAVLYTFRDENEYNDLQKALAIYGEYKQAIKTNISFGKTHAMTHPLANADLRRGRSLETPEER